MATLIDGIDAKRLDSVPTFQECYALVECEMLEAVRFKNGSVLLVDEDGLQKRSRYNEIASEIATSGTGETHFIVGKAVFLTKDEADKVLG